MQNKKEFSFLLPPERIAQTPRRRGTSRLMILPKQRRDALIHTTIRDLPQWLLPGDCLVVNDSKVIPARLIFFKHPTQAKIEVLLLREESPGCWEALAKPCRRLKAGTWLIRGEGRAHVSALLGQGRILLKFESRIMAKRILHRYGQPPLPPYIHRQPNHDWRQDRRRYQTLFASRPGSVAAPTAGLHFSRSLLNRLQAQHIEILSITLHVGWGTFAPLPDGDLSKHKLHVEHYSIPPETAEGVECCRARGNRIIACGTTVARTLESAWMTHQRIRVGEAETRLFIRPGYSWKIVDGLLTNFHLPESSLLLLACAFGGKQRVLAAYQNAIQKQYNFYSYGDAMLIL